MLHFTDHFMEASVSPYAWYPGSSRRPNVGYLSERLDPHDPAWHVPCRIACTPCLTPNRSRASCTPETHPRNTEQAYFTTKLT